MILRIETGRYYGEPIEVPFAPESVENKIHFLLRCPAYNDYIYLFENTGFNQLL